MAPLPKPTLTEIYDAISHHLYLDTELIILSTSLIRQYHSKYSIWSWEQILLHWVLKKPSIQSAWHFPQLTPKYWSSKEPRDIGSESLSIHTHHSRNWQSYQIITFFTEWCCFGLTRWGRVTHICVGNLTTIGSDNGLAPGRRKAITWTNVGILLIGPLGTNFSVMLSKIHTFPFKKMHLKMSSGKWRPFCVGLNALTHWGLVIHIWISQLGQQ